MNTRHGTRTVPAAVALFAFAFGVHADVLLQFGRVSHDATIASLPDGGWRVRTTGTDPYGGVRRRVRQGYDPSEYHVFSFEYRCPEGLRFFEVFWGNPFNGRDHVQSKPIPSSESWRTFAVDLADSAPGRWTGGIRDYRIDFGDAPNRIIDIRNIRLRAPTAAEREAA